MSPVRTKSRGVRRQKVRQQPRRLYSGTCKVSGKRQFASAIDVLIEHATNPRKIKAYKCEHCDKYHAATADGRGRLYHD